MEPDRAHANKCALSIMCLREYFPLDVIGLIVSICWHLRSMPVYALLANSEARALLHDTWEIMKHHIPKLYPQLKLRQIKSRSIYLCLKDKSDRKSEYVYMSLLIPGWVWDQIMIDYHCIDNDVVSRGLIEVDVTNMEYPPICCATMHLDSLTPISNIAWIAPSSKLGWFGDDSPQIDSFMDIQDKIAF
jgi:hypothetical protein